jgi:hypothetical protein
MLGQDDNGLHKALRRRWRDSAVRLEGLKFATAMTTVTLDDLPSGLLSREISGSAD